MSELDVHRSVLGFAMLISAVFGSSSGVVTCSACGDGGVAFDADVVAFVRNFCLNDEGFDVTESAVLRELVFEVSCGVD